MVLPLDATVWEPHAYQSRAVEFLLSHEAAAFWADPGLGKSSTVLEAFRLMKEGDSGARMLVIAPLLPALDVWPVELRKWTQFQPLTYTILHGPNKLNMLRSGTLEKTDITITNYETLLWMKKYGDALPDYTVVVYDESTRLKSPRAKRSKAARKLFYDVPFRWALTGTPAPNGYEDVFGQMLVLDHGEALGKTLSEFRMRYYAKHPYLHYQWDLLPGAVERIEARIEHMVLRLKAEDYLELPEQVDDIHKFHMTKPIAKQYARLKKDMLLALPDGIVTASNAAAVYSKLAQLANGAIYIAEDTYTPLHDIKLDALANLVDELGSQQLLVAYEFRHDKDRIARRFPSAEFLSSRMPRQKRAETIAQWNNGEIKLLCLHPAAAGHGLNLQGSNAQHICWFSATWNLELYEQTIARLLRQGNEANRVVNHILCLHNTIDELKIEALRDKDDAQERLLEGLRKELGIEPEGDSDMAVRKLGQPPETVEKEAPAEAEDSESGSAEHREEIRKLATQGDVKSAFSKDLQKSLGGDEDSPKKKKKAPARKAPKAATKKAADKDESPSKLKSKHVRGGSESDSLSARERLDAIVDMFRSGVEAITKL